MEQVKCANLMLLKKNQDKEFNDTVSVRKNTFWQSKIARIIQNLYCNVMYCSHFRDSNENHPKTTDDNESNIIIRHEQGQIEIMTELTIGRGGILMHVCASERKREREKERRGCANRLSADHWQFDCSGE